MRLIDSAMTVSRTWTLGDLLATSERLQTVAVEDLTTRVLPNVERTARIARYYLDRPRRARSRLCLHP